MSDDYDDLNDSGEMAIYRAYGQHADDAVSEEKEADDNGLSLLPT
jgi:hypothetical protein